MISASTVNPRGMEWMQDPRPLFEAVLAHGIIRTDEACYIGRHEDVTKFLKTDTRKLQQDHLDGPLMRTMLFQDGHDHRRLRKIVQAPFSPKGLRSIEAHVQRLCDKLFETVRRSETTDFVGSFATEFPLKVMTHVLGVSEATEADFRKCVTEFVQSFEPQSENAATAFNALRDKFNALLNNPVDCSEDGLWMAIRSAHIAGELSREEAIEAGCFMIVAGIESTTNSLGSAALLLLENPSELAKLANDMSLLPQAIEEILRFEAPVKVSTHRFLKEDLELADQTLPAGTCVLAIIGAANRDPQVYKEPNVFKIDRNHNPHLAFGGGSHFCLGAHLARLELQMAVRHLTPYLAQMQLAIPEPQSLWDKISRQAPMPRAYLWRNHPEIRGLAHLNLQIRR